MRINYYEFPEGIDDITRAENGADVLEKICEADNERWKTLDNPYIDCPHKTSDFCRDCEHLKCVKAEFTVSGISVTRAKQLLAQFGGNAFTYHIDRDGGLFETTDIKPNNNNSRFKYNRHL